MPAIRMICSCLFMIGAVAARGEDPNRLTDRETAVGFELLFNESKKVQKRPNFIVVMADDASWNTFDCLADGYAPRTPNISKLATEGLVFDRCFTTSSRWNCMQFLPGSRARSQKRLTIRAGLPTIWPTPRRLGAIAGCE